SNESGCVMLPRTTCRLMTATCAGWPMGYAPRKRRMSRRSRCLPEPWSIPMQEWQIPFATEDSMYTHALNRGGRGGYSPAGPLRVRGGREDRHTPRTDIWVYR